MAHTAVNNIASSGLTARIAGFLTDLKTRRAQYKVYRDTFHELSVLTDRELRDLDISRSMIRSVAYEAAYK